ncbi:hypothetical protein [Paenibacillus agilis]|uniref:Uncharacterized protein n=1 Tax=Paenibacillus agilis TaxID=3020863 RepID=A0A559IZM8_9BACL|nr:hypothetical protein [Paenibacillus agilis]TVX93074.1 hypothetical protein FPZ44_08375 [Paenibacillus agilis]
MLKECLVPWVKMRSEEIAAECESKETYDKFTQNMNLLKEKLDCKEANALLLELEELLNYQSENIATEVYNRAFNEAFDLALSIYK